MPEYVIEREMPGVGQLGTADLKAASQTSCSVNEDMIREHAQRGGFPANKISQVRTNINPTTAE